MIRYAISDPSTLDFDKLAEDLLRFERRGATMILYRDKNNPRYRENAPHFLRAVRQTSIGKALLHNDVRLAEELKADGVHLSSQNFPLITEARGLGLLAIASTHSLEEAQEAERLGAHMVTLSPLFASPGKGEPLGVETFSKIVAELHIPVIALGGIVGEEHIREASEAGAAGFASIRYFSQTFY